MSEVKTMPNSPEFFEKYRFTMTMTKKHPEFKDEMKFEGLEAHYVSRLERQVDELEKYVAQQNQKINWMMTQEFYKWKNTEEKIKKPAGVE